MRSTLYTLATAVWRSGLQLPGSDDGSSLSILCYHGVHTREMERIAAPPSSSTPADTFEASVRALRRQYTTISLTDAVDMLAGRRPWRPRCLVITFDDSLRCTTDVAFPILTRYDMTATVFVSTGAIADRQPYWWLRLDHAWAQAKRAQTSVTIGDQTCVVKRGDRESLRAAKSILRRTPAVPRDAAVLRLADGLGARFDTPEASFPYASIMTWDDARRAVANGFSVGSHTVTHPNLTLLSPAELREEFTASKRKIEAELGTTCRHLCYPYGAFNDEVARIGAECGYDAAVSTVAPGRNIRGCNLYRLNRYGSVGSARKLTYILAGCPAGIRELRQRVFTR